MQLRGGFETTDPRLDRVPQFDPRSRDYKIRTLLEAAEPRPAKTTFWQPGTTLDQGQEGACVGHGVAHRVSGEPQPTANIDHDIAVALYKRAQQLDEWEGESYEGTSVLAGCQAAQEAGYITEYRWVGAGSGTVIEDVMDTLSYVGGIVFGLPWSESMFTPRPSGLFEVDPARIAGGHCIHAFGLILGAQLPDEPVQDVVVLQNSWGADFGVQECGQGGVCYISLTDLQVLLEKGGEGAVPVEIGATPST